MLSGDAILPETANCIAFYFPEFRFYCTLPKKNRRRERYEVRDDDGAIG
jgi:hypothetical protein